jgi:hypothetical protein
MDDGYTLEKTNSTHPKRLRWQASEKNRIV